MTGHTDKNARLAQPDDRWDQKHQALLAWLDVRRSGELGQEATQLYSFVYECNFWTAIAPAFDAALCNRLSCIVGLYRRLNESHVKGTSPTLVQWKDWAQAIARNWSPGGQKDASAEAWELMVVTWAEEDNRLVNASVSLSLEESVSTLRIAAKLQQCIQQFTDKDLAWSGKLPIPPARGSSLSPSDYLLSGDWLAGWPQRLTRLADAVLNHIRGHALTKPFQTMEISVGHLQAGFPVETSRFLSAIHELTVRLKACHDETQLPPAVRDEISQVCEKLDSLKTIVAAQRGDKTANVARNGKQAGICENGYNEDRGAALAHLSDRLAQLSDPDAVALATRLTDLQEEESRSDAQGSVHQAFSRKLLSCLLSVEDLISRPGRPAPWLAEARDTLRSLLSREREFVVLERDLVGRSIRSCGNLVEAVGNQAGASVAPQHIAAVRQAGYAFKLSDGTLEAIRKAKVLLAE